MSYESTKQVLGILNSGLQTRYEEGDPLRIKVAGKPELHMLSFQPLAYEEYGFFRNRAPHVAGSLALRAFLSAPHPEGGALIIAGVEAGKEGYGFVIDCHDEGARQTITGVAKVLGHPDFRLTPS